MYRLTKIIGIKEEKNGTMMKILIPKERGLAKTIIEKRIKKAEIRLDDGRTITNDQRRKAYATIRDIADYTGYPPEELKELMKYEYVGRTGKEYFSLSDCTMDTAREFLSMMLEFCIENGIPLSEAGAERTDDIDRYLYVCIKNRICAVCGRKGEIHHVDKIGMGNDRRTIDDREYRKMCLCRKHHTETHMIGEEEFTKKYKVYGIVAE